MEAHHSSSGVVVTICLSAFVSTRASSGCCEGLGYS
jgi:hypothetical protein